jgi:hypothetical protein
MDLKIASAIVERQMFPKHTNSTEMVSGVEAIVVVVSHLLGDSVEVLNDLNLNRPGYLGRGR